MFTSEDTSTIAPADDHRAPASPRHSAPFETAAPSEMNRRRATGASVLDPLYIARAVWNAKLLIACFTILGVGLAILLTAGTPKRYLANAQILMDPRDLKVVANELTPNGLPSDATLALIESQTSVILSSNVLSRVISEAQLDADPEFNGTLRTGPLSFFPEGLTNFGAEPDVDLREREYKTLERLRRALTVSRETKSFVINLSVVSIDAEKSARLANMIANVFIDEQGRVQSDTARRATTSLSSRLTELRRSVVEAEQDVEDYKSKNALIGVGGRLVDDEYITRINDQLAQARGDITSLRVKADSMRNASVEDVVRGTLPEELSSESLVRLRQTYSDLAQQSASLSTKLGPRHPQRIASEGALAATRQAIAGELSRIVAAAQTELARAQETERTLSGQIAELKDKQIETSGSFVKLRELQREVDASRAVYEAFLLRARETSEQESLNTANVRIISEATPPLLPDGTSRKVLIAAGGIGGFLFGVTLAAMMAVFRLLKVIFAGERRHEATSRWPDQEDAVAENPPAETSQATPDEALLPARPPEVLRPAVFEMPRAAEPAPDPVRSPREVLAAALQADRDARLAEIDARLAARDRMPEPAADMTEARDVSAPERPLAAAATMQPKLAETTSPPSFASESRPDRLNASIPSRLAARAPGGLTLADVARGAPTLPSGERLSLRDRIRALSGVDAPPAAVSPAVDPEVALLRDEIQTVKQAIADIRRRREAHSASL